MAHMKDLDRRIRQGGDDAIAAVGELLPRWISVEERLPEDRDYCLVALDDSFGLAWWHNEPAPRFIHEDIDNSWTPSHWMPLPEPPSADTQRNNDA